MTAGVEALEIAHSTLLRPVSFSVESGTVESSSLRYKSRIFLIACAINPARCVTQKEIVRHSSARFSIFSACCAAWGCVDRAQALNEHAVPDSPSYEGSGRTILGLVIDVGNTGGKADLGLPSRNADAETYAVAEGQDAKGLGHLRHDDGGAFDTQGADGADTSSDSSRGGRYPMLLSDVMVAAVAGIQPLP